MNESPLSPKPAPGQDPSNSAPGPLYLALILTGLFLAGALLLVFFAPRQEFLAFVFLSVAVTVLFTGFLRSQGKFNTKTQELGGAAAVFVIILGVITGMNRIWIGEEYARLRAQLRQWARVEAKKPPNDEALIARVSRRIAQLENQAATPPKQLYFRLEETRLNQQPYSLDVQPRPSNGITRAGSDRNAFFIPLRTDSDLPLREYRFVVRRTQTGGVGRKQEFGLRFGKSKPLRLSWYPEGKPGVVKFAYSPPHQGDDPGLTVSYALYPEPASAATARTPAEPDLTLDSLKEAIESDTTGESE